MGVIEATPLTAGCGRIFEQREHALLGVSALNGFFSVPVLAELLGWAGAEFDRVDVLVPGAELAGTLVARGYSPQRARKKAREEINNTRNRVMRALDGLDLRGVGVFSWTDLMGQPAYARLRSEVERLFRTDSAFREHCVTAVAPIVDAPSPSGEQVASAVPFLLAELPLVLDSPSILGTGSSLFCYPKLMPMADLLFAGMLPIFPVAGQGILTIQLTGIGVDEHHDAGVFQRGGT